MSPAPAPNPNEIEPSSGENSVSLLTSREQVISQAYVSLHELQARATDAGLNCDVLGLKQNSDAILMGKSVHSVIAAEFLYSCLEMLNSNAALSPNSVRALVLMEMLLVDFPDSLGEFGPLRVYETQLNFFEGLRDALFNGVLPNGLFPQQGVSAQNEVLSNWQKFLLSECIQFHEDFIKKGIIPDDVAKILAEMNTAYFNFIAVAHSRSGIPAEMPPYFLRYAADLKENNRRKQKPSWVESNSELWPMFFGESISWLAVTLLAVNGDIKAVSDVLPIIRAYCSVGILNVLLDDIVDEQEDTKDGDPNLWREITAGRFGNSKEGLISKLKSIYKISSNDSHAIFLIALIKQVRLDFTKEMDFPLVDVQRTILPRMLNLYAMKLNTEVDDSDSSKLHKLEVLEEAMQN
jgi:hypothetical protein